MILFFTRLPVFRLGFTACLLAAHVLPALGQQSFQTLLVGVDHRTAVTSLDGDWHYLVDYPPFRALYTGSGAINDNGYALNSHPNIAGGPHNDEYDFATAPTLKVPGDWNTQVPQLFSYEGVVFYQRDFDAEPKPGTRTFLHIGAANYRSHVWVNRKRVCDHEGGFTPFDCELTAILHPGSNFIVIGVDATRLQDGIPSVGYDWYNYGGLTRDVSLVTVPTAFIDDYDILFAYRPRLCCHHPRMLAGARQANGWMWWREAALLSSKTIKTTLSSPGRTIYKQKSPVKASSNRSFL